MACSLLLTSCTVCARTAVVWSEEYQIERTIADLRELRPALDQMGVKNVDDKAVSDWMTRYDSSRGVRLELAEFVRLVQDVIAKQHADSTMDFFFSEKVKGAFQYVDVDRSGKLGKKELAHVLDLWNIPIDDEKLDDLVFACDNECVAARTPLANRARAPPLRRAAPSPQHGAHGSPAVAL